MDGKKEVALGDTLTAALRDRVDKLERALAVVACRVWQGEHETFMGFSCIANGVDRAMNLTGGDKRTIGEMMDDRAGPETWGTDEFVELAARGRELLAASNGEQHEDDAAA